MNLPVPWRSIVKSLAEKYHFVSVVIWRCHIKVALPKKSHYKHLNYKGAGKVGWTKLCNSNHVDDIYNKYAIIANWTLCWRLSESMPKITLKINMTLYNKSIRFDCRVMEVEEVHLCLKAFQKMSSSLHHSPSFYWRHYQNSPSNFYTAVSVKGIITGDNAAEQIQRLELSEAEKKRDYCYV